MSKILSKILEYFKNNPEKLRDASRVAKQSFESAKDVANWVKNNKFSAATVAYTMGDAGTEIIDLLRSDARATPELIEAINYLELKPDAVPGEGITSQNIEMFADEFAAIDNVAARMGGYDNLAELMFVLRMDVKVLTTHAKLRALVS